MLHLFVLFPILIILGVVMFQLQRSYPKEISYLYLRNFFIIWSICTIAVGLAETVFGHEAKGLFIALALAIPFLYLASSFLILLPFALEQKRGALSKTLAIFVVALGVLYGLSIYIKANGLEAATGPLKGLFENMSQNIFTYHIVSMLLIFGSVGLYFLYKALTVSSDRVRAFLIGIGLIIAGVAEWYHVVGLHAAARDFVIILGFGLILVGLLYPLWIRPAQTTQ